MFEIYTLFFQNFHLIMQNSSNIRPRFNNMIGETRLVDASASGRVRDASVKLFVV